MHSPNQMIDLGDLDAACELIAEYLVSLSADEDFAAR
jgi:putative aminopeptidase FrvX